jgi:hypothetical protein
MDQFNEFDVFDTVYPEVEAPLKPEIDTPPPPQSNASNASNALTLPPLAVYPSRDALFEAIQGWAKPRGYAFTIGKSKRLESRRQKVYYACDRCYQARPRSTERSRSTQSRGTGCLFSVLAVELSNSLGWEVKYRPEAKYNIHNHPPSQSPAAHPSHRHLSTQAQSIAQNLFSAGKYIVINIEL